MAPAPEQVTPQTPTWAEASFATLDDEAALAMLSERIDQAVARVLDGIEYPGDLAGDAAVELDAIQQGFRDRRDREAERAELVTMTDYYFCVCFATRQQRQAFLDGVGWDIAAGDRYLDGRALAKRDGVELPPDPVFPAIRRDSTWDDLAAPLGPQPAPGEEDTP